ncbi:AbrB/MazE/SpoVT family DNA-binding domain-containing protein [Thiothrix litoralis]|jgi:AbrB family looped-hinge helix DNA binding protein|uniref:AbrB/MazE/SpoVT family DNA-binding domain-containing protein n=1 Tax=Thiothrix litoralis TaxID=2891210 RepID=A0ABX7WTC0_9GAMM|nr:MULTISPECIES: AbrB/MazE/SpoVT family DNA-binding domain-containing protein [Thiothrix]QTR47096.1 AbrB/MazE/SpoVT family DNA-binding domain-containing protein [Thiothrix litoralis]WMP18093.1 AbrB/MazE/SpoVT family DNA-binding domain-containing protein [Thiothrix lacustris]
MQAFEIAVTQQGRMVIPSLLRKQLGLKSGSRLMAHLENGRLILEPKELLWEKIYQEMSAIPAKTDLAQELIDERRESAGRE